VKFLGWNIATETTLSYLFKNINAAWTDNDLGFVNWTWPNYYRSFWAMNPDNVEYANPNFAEAGALKVGRIDANGDMIYGDSVNVNYTYVQENASPYNTGGTAAVPTKATKIIVASQLVDKDGNVVELAEFKGFRSDIAGTLGNMANLSTIYYQAEGKRVKITPEMIQFADDDTYAVLTEAAESNTFYLSGTATETATVEQVNVALKNLGTAKVWKDGKSYYYTDIRHLGKITEADGVQTPSVGAYGVVRNHSYQVVVTSVTGLGTPVYNPDEVIDPETPEEEESYLAARIKVLSWRVVKSTVDLK